MFDSLFINFLNYTLNLNLINLNSNFQIKNILIFWLKNYHLIYNNLYYY